MTKISLFFIILVAVCFFNWIPVVSGSPIQWQSENSSQIFSGWKNGIEPTNVQQTTSIDDWKDNLSANQKKISSQILLLTTPKNELPEGVNTENIFASMKSNNQIQIQSQANETEPTLFSLSDQVFVYISLSPGTSTEILEPLVSTMVARDETNHIVAAWVEISKINEISNLSSVQQITLVTPPIVKTGSKTSEGDTILKSDLVRNLSGGPNGTGIKVGVISDGVDHYTTSQSTGDLPGTFQILSNEQGGDEGTAMGEIIYDIAPGSEIAFSDMANNYISFAQHMQDLADAGCNVIVDDISYASEPFFEDGLIAQKANSLYSSNHVVVSSSGNDAKTHSIGLFTPINGTTDMNWSSVGSASSYPGGDYLYVKINPNTNVRVILQWDDKWGNSTNDYDLYLETLSGMILSSSINYQNGTGSNPYEFLFYRNTNSSPLDTRIRVHKKTGASKTLEVYIWGGSVYQNNIVESSSSYGHPCADGTIGVAAIPYSSPNSIESFSSRGPRPIAYPTAGFRNVPEVSGIDGNVISGAGDWGYWDGSNYRFFGTSASAPHVAAVAALLWSKDPSKPAADIRHNISSTAIPLESSGYNWIFGHGRVDALAAYYSLYPVPTPTVTPTVTPTQTISPDGKLHASFTATPTLGRTPLEVMFTDTSSGSPTWWKWYFGDGKMSTDQNPVHQYIAKGKYTVRLLVGKDTIFSYICMLQMIDTTKENSTLNILYANESTTSTIKPGMDLIWDENSTEPQQISPQ